MHEVHTHYQSNETAAQERNTSVVISILNFPILFSVVAIFFHFPTVATLMREFSFFSPQNVELTAKFEIRQI